MHLAIKQRAATSGTSADERREVRKPPARMRVCIICGRPLVNHRAHARACSASCRAEASRLKAIMEGTYSGRYRSVAERLSKARHTSPLGIALGQRRKAVEAHTATLVTSHEVGVRDDADD